VTEQNVPIQVEAARKGKTSTTEDNRGGQRKGKQARAGRAAWGVLGSAAGRACFRSEEMNPEERREFC